MLLTLSIVSVPVSHICCLIKPYRLNTIDASNGVEITGYELNYVNKFDLEFNIDIPSKIHNKKVKSIGEYAFHDCKYFDELVIPEGVETIKEYAFTNASFKNLILPQTLISIEKGAFKLPDSLINEPIDYIILPENLRFVGLWAFHNTAKHIFVLKSETEIDCEENWCNKNDKTFTNLSGQIYFSEYETVVHYDVRDIKIEEDVLYLLYDSNVASVGIIFDKKEVNILDELSVNDEKYVVTSIEARAGFQGEFETIYIPRTIETIEREAFAYNGNMKNINIPSSVLFMGNQVFVGYENIVVNIEQEEIPSGWNKEWSSKNITVNLNVEHR